MNSPRIRGDDPGSAGISALGAPILPVFAGMIPAGTLAHHGIKYSPRIRGDDPVEIESYKFEAEFSPYSRG